MVNYALRAPDRTDGRTDSLKRQTGVHRGEISGGETIDYLPPPLLLFAFCPWIVKTFPAPLVAFGLFKV